VQDNLPYMRCIFSFKKLHKMKILLTAIILFCFTNILFGQIIVSGEYQSGLKLAFDSKAKKLTGYYENDTGWDEETKRPKFSCIFYLGATVTGNTFSVLTYYPQSKSEDTISGFAEIVNDSTVKIKLPQEHGGCWNVQHFADEPVKFDIEKKADWTQVKYVTVEKTFFYSEKSNDKKLKAYLVKNNFVCINKTERDWAYSTYYGKEIVTGWIKTSDLNNP